MDVQEETYFDVDAELISKLWGSEISGEEEIISRLGGYRIATPEEREAHILHVLKRLHETKLLRNTTENKEVFEAGWNENYQMCLENGVSRESLTPRYVKPFRIVRFNGDYVLPENPFFINEMLGLFTTISFKQYLQNVENIYEYGCGTGRYVFELANIFPEKKIAGLDWTESSKKILELVAKSGKNVDGFLFDMLNPSYDVKLPENSAIVTVGALEQIGDRYEKFLSYMLAQKPEIVIHHEPILDFYSDDTLFDYLGKLWHLQRNYLNGYVDALKKLESEGKIEIINARRLFYGDPYHESTSLIVWRPL